MSDHRKAETLFLKGIEAVGRNTIALAAGLFRSAVQEDPHYVDALFNLGKACKDLGRLQEAAEAFRRIVDIDSRDAEAWYMYGNTALAMDQYQTAEECYRRMIAINSRDSRAHTNLAVALQYGGNPRAAIDVLAAALLHDPDNPDFHYNRALALLLAGDYEEGWREFEWRFHTTDSSNPLPRMPLDRWDGTPAAGNTIVLVAEQGLGDTIQFARFIPAARKRCDRIVLECHKDLHAVLRSCAGVDAVVEQGHYHGRPGDVWAPLMSLPFLLGCPMPASGARIPYLSADTRRVEHWQERLAPSRMRARVGIIWAGNPRHKNDRNRSCPPDLFTQMIRSTEVVWASLQKSEPHGLPSAWQGIVNNVGPALEDFGDTAAAIECLDLVITVDTAAAHLAGAMGKTVWLLVPFAPDWRWMLSRSDSAWYPTMRMYRQPRPGDWQSVIGNVTADLQRLQQHYARSLASPGDTSQYLEYANALREAGLRDHAVRIYRMVVHLDARNLAAWNNLGITLQDGGELESAIEAFGMALQADPGNAAVMNNLGFALLERGDCARAEEWLRRGIARDPRIPDLHNNLGNALRDRGVLNDATASYRHSISLRPDFAQAHWNLAQVLLQKGEFLEGWEEYEWRWCRPDFTSPRRNFSQPQWNGEPIAGRTILVHAEQGFGDALQFVRYVPAVAATKAIVLLECHAELTRLFAGMPGVAHVLAHGAPLPGFDVHIPMMSLPRVFRSTLETLPAHVPYLAVDGQTEASWRSLLGERKGSLRVGFTWSGMQHLKALMNRACPLESLLPLVTTPGAEFYSLQKSVTPSDAAVIDAVPGVQNLGGLLHDFADTAAAIRALDIVVSVDTAVAHLAGALGVTTWVLIPFNADWRWLLDRDDSPWYPTMTLFRQEAPGTWDGAIRRVRAALDRRIALQKVQLS